MRPRIFGEFVGGNLATDIAAVIGAPEGLFDAQQIAAENPSISRVGQALIVAINRVLASGIHDETLIHARSRIATAFGGPGERWSEQEAALRQAPFEAGNEAVRRQWFPDRSALFGPRPEPAEPNTTTEHIDVLVDVLSELSKRSGHA